MTRRLPVAFLATALSLAGLATSGQEIARNDLVIQGMLLEIDDSTPWVAALDLPLSIPTKFGGRSGEGAPLVPGVTAVGDLTGPGLDEPISLRTQPGQPFALPPLHLEGDYVLQNIRLVGSDGAFLQQAVPATLKVAARNVLQSSVRIRQLTPDELRARGIHIDERLYTGYEVILSIVVQGQAIDVSYPIIVNRSTGAIEEPPTSTPYQLPPTTVQAPPRFTPPRTIPILLRDDLSPGTAPTGAPSTSDSSPGHISIPAAIVIPNGFAILHNFFSVILNIQNGAPQGSAVRLDEVSAKLNAPLALRVARSVPAVGSGQPLPILAEASMGAGPSVLVAQAMGSGEWDLEALRSGTHEIEIEIRATYQSPGQPDVALHGVAKASVVVSDPRFHIAFSHPDVVRAGSTYSAWAFVTNLSPQRQQVKLDISGIPQCPLFGGHICRVDGTPSDATIDFAPGEMKPVEYRLQSQIDGHAFAAAGTADDDLISVGVKLTMGVSQSGIALSPATLVLPYYCRYLDPALVAAQTQLLGLGYSVATAPVNQRTSNFPRVISSDVFTRAVDLTRAGQRMLIRRHDPSTPDPLTDREPLFQLSLDLLGNVERVDKLAVTPELREWDELRRSQAGGRSAGAALARQLEASGMAGGKSASQFVDDFAAATAHRSPYFFALVHGPPVSGSDRPYAVTLTGATTHVHETLALACPALSGENRGHSTYFARRRGAVMALGGAARGGIAIWPLRGGPRWSAFDSPRRLTYSQITNPVASLIVCAQNSLSSRSRSGFQVVGPASIFSIGRTQVRADHLETGAPGCCHER
jgi:hypothetical protein